MADEDELLDEVLCGQGLLGRDCDVAHHVAPGCVEVHLLQSVGPLLEFAGLNTSVLVSWVKNVVVEHCPL